MIQLEAVSLSFGRQKVLHEMSLSTQLGEVAVLAGKSGCGKSSVLQILLGFLKPTNGHASVDNLRLGKDPIAEIRSRLAWLPQELRLGSGKVEEVIQKPFTFRGNRISKPSPETVGEALSKLGLASDILKKDIHDLSGGERQRIGIALCALLRRPVWLLDEPTSALDDVSCDCVLAFVQERRGTTILSASHDPRWIEFCSRNIPMGEGL